MASVGTLQGLLGLGLGALGAFGIVANLRLPVLGFPAEGPARLAFWHDLFDLDGLAYEVGLLVGPLVAYALALVAAVLLLVALLRAGRGARAAVRLRIVAWWTVTIAGFLLLLTASRWVGFYAARVMDPGDATVHLHAVPYVNGAIGLLFLGSGVWSLRGPYREAVARWPVHRWEAASAAAAAVGLWALPLFPFATLRLWGGFRMAVDELTMALLEAQTSSTDLGAPEALAYARVTLWLALFAGLSSTVVGQLEVSGRLPRGVAWLRYGVLANGLFVVAGAVFTVAFYVWLPDLRPGVEVGWNLVLPLTLAALGLLWVAYVRALRRRPTG